MEEVLQVRIMSQPLMCNRNEMMSCLQWLLEPKVVHSYILVVGMLCRGFFTDTPKINTCHILVIGIGMLYRGLFTGTPKINTCQITLPKR